MLLPHEKDARLYCSKVDRRCFRGGKLNPTKTSQMRLPESTTQPHHTWICARHGRCHFLGEAPRAQHNEAVPSMWQQLSVTPSDNLSKHYKYYCSKSQFIPHLKYQQQTIIHKTSEPNICRKPFNFIYHLSLVTSRGGDPEFLPLMLSFVSATPEQRMTPALLL